MPGITRFRGARGRFLPRNPRPEDVVSVEFYDVTGGPRSRVQEPEEYFEPTIDAGPSPFWTVETDEETIIWKDFEQGRNIDPDEISPPEGVSGFRVFLNQTEGGNSPRGIISSKWAGIEAWRTVGLDMVHNRTATGFSHIVFER